MQLLFDFFQQFQKLSDADKLAIDSTCSVIKVEKQQIIEPVGSTSKTLYFLKSGIVRIFYYKDGLEVTEFFAFAGDLVARVKSMLTQQTSSKAIQMLEAGELIAIDMPSFLHLFEKHPNIERLFRLLLEDVLVKAVDRIESIQFHSAAERYAAIMEEQKLIQKVQLKYIASFLGITQVSLSRIRANYNNQG